MPEPRFAPSTEDDLPRTVLRQREAREREAREREAQDGHVHDANGAMRHDFGDEPSLRDYPPGSGPVPAGTVTALAIPFGHLVGFFLKAVLAAIPALVLLTVLLWLGGQALAHFLPGLSKMQILIHFPK